MYVIINSERKCLFLKRLGLVLVGVSLLFLATGCGGKKLSCSMEEDGQKTTVEVKYDSKDNIETVSMEYTISFEGLEVTDEEIDEFINEMKETAKEENYKLEATKKSDSVTIKMEVTADKVDDALGEEYHVGYDELKALFEEEGATCK